MQLVLERVVAASSVTPSLSPEEKWDIKGNIEIVFLRNTRFEVTECDSLLLQALVKRGL